MKRIQIGIVVVCLFAASVYSACAQVTKVIEGNDEQPTTFRMTISPAPEPKPALKYRFLVPPVDRIKGNAATFYYKSLVFHGINPVDEVDKLLANEEKEKSLMEAPLSEFPQDEVRKYFSVRDGNPRQPLREAARCDHCDWGDPIREYGISLLLEQSQKLRSLARYLAVEARSKLAQGEIDEAFEILQLGYAMSRDLGHGTCLIQSLIGVAIQGMLEYQTRELIAAENSPNLYWALTDLAAQPVDFRQAYSYESRFWEFTIHELTELDRRIFTPEEAMELAKKLSNIEHLSESLRQAPPLPKQAELLGIALVYYPQASRYLLEHGFTQAKLDSMPVLQVVILYWWKQYRIVNDDVFKLLCLPDSEIRANLKRGDKRAHEASRTIEGGVFVNFLPAIQAAYYARERSTRQTALLRVVEALRMHAAEHGDWPAKLDDVTVVPVPIDPWTDKPFEYSLKDGVATVQMANEPRPPGGLSVNQRYELILRKTSRTTASEQGK